MQIKSFKFLILSWLFIGIPLLTYLVLQKSFNLGLYGDDWQHLYNMWREFYVYKTKSFFDIRSYLNPYWPNYFYLGIIQHFWDFYPPAYFIVSYLLRVFATISLFAFAKELTKSKLGAFFATLFFIFSAAGLQTTDWVFNMNTYAGLGFLSLAFTLYLKIRTLPKISVSYLSLYALLFAIGMAIVPTRTQGAVPFIIGADLFLNFFVEKRKFKIDKSLLIRILITILVFCTLFYFKSFGEGSYTKERLISSQQIIQVLIENGYYDFWAYFIGVLGHIVIPDTFNISFLSATIIFTLLNLAITFILANNKKNALVKISIFNVLLFFLVLWIKTLSPNPNNEKISAIFFGSQYILLTFWVYSLTRKAYPNLASTLIIAGWWIIVLTLIYWIFTPYFIIETTGRYMLMGAAGLAMSLGSLLSMLFLKAFSLKTKHNPALSLRQSLYLLISLFIMFSWSYFHIKASQLYLGTLEKTRNRFITEKAWNKLRVSVPKLPPGRSVFYFTTDNPLSLYGVFTFGFYMRFGMEWRIPDEHDTPLSVTDYKELIAYVKDGSPAKTIHGRKAIPVPISNVFAFDFRNSELTDITESIRNQLVIDIK